jgi:hypothetical protein
LEGGSGEKICTAIPTNIRKTAEFIRDFWNSGCDNGVVLLKVSQGIIVGFILFRVAIPKPSRKRTDILPK